VKPLPVHPALLAVVGGLAWGLCHSSRPLPGLAFVALVPLALLLGAPRRAGLFGWLHGIVSWSVQVAWIVPTVTTYGHLPGWLGGLALLALAAYLGLYDAVFAALGARLWRRARPLDLAALPALWVLLELLRGYLVTGFPWNLAAYAWTAVPGALPLASWVGALGVSALVLAPGLGLARSWVTGRRAPFVAGFALPAILLPIAARFAAPPSTPGTRADLAIVQPATPVRPLFDPRASEEDYRRLLALTDGVCERDRLVIWPESAAWPRDWQDDPRLRGDVERRVERGCSLLFNTPFAESGRWHNSVLLAAPGAAPERADKRHLVPFGEYVPLREALPFLGRIARTVGDFAPARGIELLDWRDQRLGAAVCYEVIFPGEVRELVAAGATALVTITNDAWYGDTAAPRQHLRAARFRAAENRRWLARAAITGISALVRPDGSLAGRIEVGEEGTIVSGFVGRDDLSPWSRSPWLVPAAALALAAAALASAATPRRS
jgi:apolipoprotein N-acyltransferase